jgi:hypothetical protein
VRGAKECGGKGRGLEDAGADDLVLLDLRQGAGDLLVDRQEQADLGLGQAVEDRTQRGRVTGDRASGLQTVVMEMTF